MRILRDVQDDFRKLTLTFKGIREYIHKSDSSDACLALFSASSNTAYFGRGNHYTARVFNPDSSDKSLRLSIDIYPISEKAQTEYASFTSALFCVSNKKAEDIEIQYDWQVGASMSISGSPLKVNDMRQEGICISSTIFGIQASLQDVEGKPLDRLTIYQRLICEDT